MSSASPGSQIVHQAMPIVSRPSVIMRPHDAVPGGTPTVRKLRAASARITSATSSVMMITTVFSTFGNRCLRMIHQPPAPVARDAVTKSRSRSESTSARTSRAYEGHVQTSRMMITLRRLGPTRAASSTAKRIAGSASCTSTSRIRSWPIRPPTQPATSPVSVPTSAAPGTTIPTTITEMRAPCTKRLYMSRPRSSVPSGYAQVPPSKTGGCRRFRTSMCSGSYGASTSAPAPQTSSTSTIRLGMESPSQRRQRKPRRRRSICRTGALAAVSRAIRRPPPGCAGR